MFIQNIRSIKCNLTGLLSVLVNTRITWDCIVLTECWLPSTPNIPVVDGYNSYATVKNSSQNEGVVVYFKNQFIISVEEKELAEANCLIVKSNGNTITIAIYRPPGYKNVNNFIQSLNELLQHYSSVQNIIILGDINIDIASSSTDCNKAPYLDMLAYNGCLPAYTTPTHGKTCLDHVLLRTRLSAKCLILPTSLTDHESIALYISSPLKAKPPKFIDRLDLPAFDKAIKLVDFSPICDFDDVNLATNFFITTIRKIITANTKTIKITCRKRLLKPWMTPGMLRCIRNRDNLYKKTKNDPNNEILRITYMRYRNYCTLILKKLKGNYEKIQIQNCKQNNKKLWKTIKSITNTTKVKDSPHELLSSGNDLQDVNLINNYFGSIGRVLVEKIKAGSHRTSLFKPKTYSHSFVLLPTDCFEIKTELNNLKSDSAVGLDMISANILKLYSDLFKLPITHICNLSFSTGIFPTSLKKSRIHPVYKGSGARDCVNNYRPISILPTLSKILERLLNKRLIKYLEEHNLLSNAQFGFRAEKSTADAVHELTNIIVRNLDKKEKTIAIFLDLAKAFDTVSVPLLLEKLERLGIRGLQLKLFRSYLSDRTQLVGIGNVQSDELPVTYGVPQGSILGPTLFLAYINELCQLHLPHNKIYTYADDTALVFWGDTWAKAFSYAQKGFDIVNIWLQANGLTLNVDKTRYMTFSMRGPAVEESHFSIHSHTCPNNSVLVCSCPSLQAADSVKYLGVIIDRNLSFKEHIEQLSKRVRKLIFVFKNLRHVADRKVIRTVYLSLCQSLITYCITSWGGVAKKYLLLIERSQRAILKISSFLPFFHPTTDVYLQSDVLTVRQLFVLHTVIKQHSIIGFDPALTSQRRRKDRVCNIGKSNTSFSQNYFYYLGASLYNKVNRVLSIYAHTTFTCQSVIIKWLKTLDYGTTENLLHS